MGNIHDFQLDEFYLDLQQDGSTIRLMSEKDIVKNPFPGLRPFKTSEFQLFKGRDIQTAELLKRLSDNHFLSVIGSSGTGKSSLVRAGLIPQLFGGFLQKAGSKWAIAICRPGKDPMRNLSVALSSIKTRSKEKEKIIIENESIEASLRKSPYGILDIKGQWEKDNPDDNLLIIIDQFEELFRFDRQDIKSDTGNLNIESQFVQLLLQASSGINPKIFVIITMRSEFLGDCVKYRGLPEAINQSQYLVPQLNHPQLREVIEFPFLRVGKKIEPGFADILINEIEDEKVKENLDQLPILQHALMRTYDGAFNNKANASNDTVTYKDYLETGGMKEALARHAQAVYEKLDDKDKRITEILFRTLTDTTSDQKGGRRPTQLKTIYAIAGVVTTSHDEINKVINVFRNIETSFIMPPNNTALYPDIMLDISHESLMRHWVQLKSWMDDEVKNSILYKKLNERREQHGLDGDSFLSGVLLKDLMEWRSSGFYNAAWAGRYQDITTANNQTKEDLYENNLEYLAVSQKQSVLKLEKDQKDKDRKFRNKVGLLIACLVALISLGFGGFVYKQRNELTLSNTNFKNQLTLTEKEKKQKDVAQAKLNKTNGELKLKANDLTLQAILLKKQTNALKKLNAEVESLRKKEEFEKIVAQIKEKECNVAMASEHIDDDLVLEIPNITNEDRKTAKEVLLPLKLSNDTKYNTVFNSINSAIKVQDSMPIDPNIALFKANLVKKVNTNDLTVNVFKNIIDHAYFYQQKVVLENSSYYSKVKYNAASGKVYVKDYSSLQSFDYKDRKITSGSSCPMSMYDAVADTVTAVVDSTVIAEDTVAIASVDTVYSFYDEQFIADDSTIYYLKNGGVFSKKCGDNSKNPRWEISTPFEKGVFTNDGLGVVLVLPDKRLRYINLSKEKTDTKDITLKDANVKSIQINPYNNEIILVYPKNKFQIFKIKDGNLETVSAVFSAVSSKSSNRGDENQNSNLFKSNEDKDSYEDADEYSNTLFAVDSANNIATLAANTLYFVKQKSNTKSVPLELIKLPEDAYVSKIVISPSGSKILVVGDKTFLYLLDEQKTEIEATKTLSNDVKNALFLDETTLLTLGSDMKIWKTDVNLNYDSESILQSVERPYISSLEKLKLGLISKEDILKIDNTEEIKNVINELTKSYVDYGNYENVDWESFKMIESLHNKLGALTQYRDESYKKNHDDIVVRNLYYSFTKNTAEIESGDYARLIKRLEKAQNNILSLGGTYNNCSAINLLINSEIAWLKMLNNQAGEAYQYAKTSCENSSDADNIFIKNYALACLLDKRYGEAESLYEKYKEGTFNLVYLYGKYLPNYYDYHIDYYPPNKDIFLKDIEIMVKKGLLSDDDPEVKKIRNIIMQ